MKHYQIKHLLPVFSPMRRAVAIAVLVGFAVASVSERNALTNFPFVTTGNAEAPRIETSVHNNRRSPTEERCLNSKRSAGSTRHRCSVSRYSDKFCWSISGRTRVSTLCDRSLPEELGGKVQG